MLHAKLSMTARQFADAESTLRKAAALPNPPAEAYTLLGQLFIAQGKLADATKEFLELVEEDPRSVRAHVMLGLLLHAQRDARGAIEHYERAVELDPQTAASAANNLAWLYAEQGENLDRALELAQMARTHLAGRRRAARHARMGLHEEGRHVAGRNVHPPGGRPEIRRTRCITTISASSTRRKAKMRARGSRFGER